MSDALMRALIRALSPPTNGSVVSLADKVYDSLTEHHTWIPMTNEVAEVLRSGAFGTLKLEEDGVLSFKVNTRMGGYRPK